MDVADASDAFPLDNSEAVDTDLDGIGNNADTDDDGDGVADAEDSAPLDPSIGIISNPLNLTVSADGASAVRLTGPWWSWDPNGGPVAADNDDSTWTVTLDSAPTENMQYLWVVDGVQENLIDNAAGGECSAEIDAGALITDYFSWANRVWVLDSGDASNTYEACAGTKVVPPTVLLTVQQTVPPMVPPTVAQRLRWQSKVTGHWPL